MSNFSKRAAIGLILSTFAWSACGASGGSGTSVGGPPLQAAVAQAGDAATSRLAGQYEGTVQDSTFKKGRATASLVQHGSAVGGSLVFVYGKAKVANVIAASLASDNALHGTAVATIGNAACTFSVTGQYATATYRLSGSYRAVHGCSGETGTYALKEQCYYAIGNALTRPRIAGLKPC